MNKIKGEFMSHLNLYRVLVQELNYKKRQKFNYLILFEHALVNRL